MTPAAATLSQARPAGYGQSCTNCSRTKCKCILPADGGACERCRRLGKSCQPIHTSRRRTAKKAAVSRTAQLEEKLDDLVSILKSSQGPQHTQTQSHSQQSTPPNIQQPQQQYQQLQKSTPTYGSAAKYFPPYTERQQSSHTSSALDSLAHAATSERQGASADSSAAVTTPSGSEPSPQEAEECLSKFRTWLRHFPFVHLPPAMTAAALRVERPFLWLCIMDLTVTSNATQTLLQDRVRREVSERIVIQNERSMDLLQGLVAFLAWTALNSASGSKSFVVLYTHLATLMVNELGLLRPPDEEHFSAIGFKTWSASPYTPKTRTMEERRAVLAVWYLSSISNAFTARAETLSWTPHLDECLELIERGDCQAQDQMLATLVKLQRIIDEAHRYLILDLMPPRKGGTKAPTYLYKPGLLERLKNIRKEIPDRYSYNNVVAALSSAAEAQTHAIGLFSSVKMPDAQSVEAMYMCITCTKTFYDTFFAIPLTEIPELPFYVYVAHSSLQTMLYRLTLAENPIWDKEIIRSTADVISIMDRTIQLFENITHVFPSHEHEIYATLFSSGVKYMRSLRAAWQPAVAKQYGGLPTPSSQNDGSMGQAAHDGHGGGMQTGAETAGMMPDGPSIDFNDISWMADIFGPWQM